jgi:hypothetical protein
MKGLSEPLYQRLWGGARRLFVRDNEPTPVEEPMRKGPRSKLRV